MKKATTTSIFAALLLFHSLPASAFTPRTRWSPKPYRQYLIKMEVERDTTAVPSVMLSGRKGQQKVDITRFKVDAFWVPDPPSLFGQEDKWRDKERYTKGHWLGDFLEDIINNILL